MAVDSGTLGRIFLSVLDAGSPKVTISLYFPASIASFFTASFSSQAVWFS